MIFNEKGLIRAMKNAYKDDGYTVAASDTGLMISSEMWGVQLNEKAIPNTVKSLIVLHAGKIPEPGNAISVHKNETGAMFFDMAVARMEELHELYISGKRWAIKPTRLTMDGYRVWQLPENLCVHLIDPDNQQILDYSDHDAYLVGNTVFGLTVYGALYVCREMVPPEDQAMIAHLEQMQWIPVELG